MTLFQNKLEAINKELKIDKAGVTIQNRRNEKNYAMNGLKLRFQKLYWKELGNQQHQNLLRVRKGLLVCGG